jgi:hypothetical protein
MSNALERFAMRRSENVAINEILFRPTRQEM